MASIFDNQDNKPSNKWWKKDKVGAKIEGTLVSKRTAHDSLSGKIKHIYELKATRVSGEDVGGERWNVQGGAIDANPRAGIDVQMDSVRLGQIVGFEYIGDKPPKTPGFHPAKLVQVWQNPRIVDTQWLKENGESVAEDESDEATEPFPTNNPARKAEKPLTEKELEDVLRKDFGAKIPEAKPLDFVETIRLINNLSVERLGSDTPEKVKIDVALATGLALTEANLPAILVKMQALPEKKK